MFIPFRDENIEGELNKNKIPFVTIALIAINLAMFIVKVVLIPSDSFGSLYSVLGTIPSELITGIPKIERPFPFFITLFTSIFVHSNWMHLFGNMILLWLFGKRLEKHLGIVKFIMFYFLCGIISSYASAFALYYDLLPRFIISGKDIPTIGASGAISGCMGAYLVRFPKAIIDIIFIFFPIRIRAYWFLGIWIFMQIMNVIPIGGETENNTAWFAHLGGFAGGIIIILIVDGIRSILKQNKHSNNDKEQEEDSPPE